MGTPPATGTSLPPFAVAERSYGSEPRTERHDFLQVVLPLVGALEMTVGGETGSVAGLRCAVVPPRCEHAFAANGANRFLIADFRGALANPGRLGTGGPFRPLDARGAALLPLLRIEAESGALAEPAVANSLGRYARAVLGLDLDEPRPEAGATRAPAAAAHEIARRVRTFLDAAWDQPVSLADAAAAAYCSPAHVTRCFRAAFGIGPVAYLQRLRIARARELLATTDLTAGEIAARVGYVSQPWFTRLFARENGMPPAAYRAMILRESGKYPS